MSDCQRCEYLTLENMSKVGSMIHVKCKCKKKEIFIDDRIIFCKDFEEYRQRK